MALSPKITVTERRKGPIALAAISSVSIGAFLGITQRGVPNEVKLCLNYADFVEQFGNPVSSSYLSDSVRAFFDNGGARCYVSRAAHYTNPATASSYDMVAGTVSLSDATPTPTILVTASSPGTWANSCSVIVTRKSTNLTTLAVAIPSGANTSATLTSASQVRVGDTLLISDTVDSITVTVTGINGNIISFASATAAPGQVDVALSTVTRLTFDLRVVDAGGATLGEWLDLRMSALSNRYAVDVVNESYRTPIRLSNLGSATADARPANSTGVRIGSTTAGTDGGSVVDADYVGSASGRTGIHVYRQRADFGMLSIPGVTAAAPTQALIDYAESRKSFLAILDLPNGTAVSAAATYVNTTVNRFSSFATYIYPWVYSMVITDGVASKTALPVCGHWQGIMARTDRARSVAKAPAGVDDGLINGIVGPITNVQEEDYDVLYPLKVNACQVVPGGTAVMGNITLDTSGEFGQIQVRRYFLDLAFYCRVDMRWTQFEPNNVSTRSKVYRNLNSRLLDQKINGVIEDYYIICDLTNNTELVRSQRRLLVTIGVKVPDAAEFIEITLEQDTRALDALIAAA